MQQVKIETSAPVKPQTVVEPSAWVRPDELCDTQVRSLTRDAFAALQVC